MEMSLQEPIVNSLQKRVFIKEDDNFPPSTWPAVLIPSLNYQKDPCEYFGDHHSLLDIAGGYGALVPPQQPLEAPLWPWDVPWEDERFATLLLSSQQDDLALLIDSDWQQQQTGPCWDAPMGSNLQQDLVSDMAAAGVNREVDGSGIGFAEGLYVRGDPALIHDDAGILLLNGNSIVGGGSWKVRALISLGCSLQYRMTHHIYGI